MLAVLKQLDQWLWYAVPVPVGHSFSVTGKENIPARKEKGTHKWMLFFLHMFSTQIVVVIAAPYRNKDKENKNNQEYGFTTRPTDQAPRVREMGRIEMETRPLERLPWTGTCSAVHQRLPD